MVRLAILSVSQSRRPGAAPGPQAGAGCAVVSYTYIHYYVANEVSRLTAGRGTRGRILRGAIKQVIEGKVVVVTGAGNGIGAEIAKLARRPAQRSSSMTPG